MDGAGTSRARRPRPRLSATTIDDVARAAGVSRQTVTRAVNDMTGISAVTKERVLRAAAELDYRPSRSGRAMARGRHDALGVAVSDLTDPFYAPLAAATMRRAGQAGHDVVLVDVASSQNPVRLLTGLTRQVDAVIAYLGRHESWTDVLSDVPTVWVGAPGDPVPTTGVRITPDPTAARAAAAAHLRASGSVHAVVLDAWAGPDRRTEIVLDALARAGLHAVTHPAGGPGYRDGHRATHEVLRRGVPDVVVGWNDPIAIGALAALAERGIGVPDQTQVLGVDGLSVAEFTAPALSTVVLDPEVVARVSVDAALRCSTGAAVGAEDRQQFVHHTFVPRGTTR
ncbi:LacI family DNA-binding transcriptional regulator [Kineococcus sp. GCM10028916]|uniref:LacI family DNA-binding transcriptional regulator n=1 Tax=Kineococcus sp. GCM10028916 TaxID=3273394 RepID=UPI00362FD011